MNRARADAVLFLVALLWGTTFVAQKSANAYVGPIFFVAARFLAGALVLLPLALWETRRNVAAGVDPRLRRRDWIAAAAVGACLCGGCWLQQIGLQSTTATNAGFLTALYVALVPFIAWVFSGCHPRPIVLLGVSVGLLGAWLLAGGAGLGHWSRGDEIVLASDLFWAIHITLIAQFSWGFQSRPILLAFLQCAITGVLSLPVALAYQPATADAVRAAVPSIVYAGIFSSGLAFTLQIVAQRHTPPAEAALIMSTESVFAAIAGGLLLHDLLPPAAWAGAFLILLGVVIVETNPLRK